MRFDLRASALVAGAIALVACAGTLDDPGAFTRAATEAGDGGGGGTGPASSGASDGGSDDAATASDAPAADGGGCGDVEATLRMRCASAGCHAAQGSAASLDLATPGVLARYANKPASGGSGMLVVPGDPASSVLYEKLTPSPPFGSRMPLGGALDDATIGCVHDWIATP